MTRRYLLITAGSQVDADTSRVLFVYLGTAAQANRDYLFLVGWAVQHGYYFELYTADVSAFLSRVLDSLKPKTIKVETFKARDVVRVLKATSQLPARQMFDRNDVHLRALLDTNYFVFRQISNRPLAKQSDV